MLVVSCCKFVTSQALMMGNIFMGGIWTTWKVLEIFTKMHFSKNFVAFLRKDGTKKWRENLKEIKKKKTLTINSRVFLAIKSLTQPWAFESEWNNYMNKCIKLRPLSLLTVFQSCSDLISSRSNVSVMCVITPKYLLIIGQFSIENSFYWQHTDVNIESPMILLQVNQSHSSH